jgi:DNA-binding NtrC family response regulator
LEENNYNVLVIDDDEEMCRLIAEVLKKEGFSVVTSADSLQAAKILRREEFDVIVTDLQMKGLKGTDLLEEATKATPLTPVIIITAFGTIESAIQAMKMGAFDYITKPFDKEELVLVVKKAVENRALK